MSRDYQLHWPEFSFDLSAFMSSFLKQLRKPLWVAGSTMWTSGDWPDAGLRQPHSVHFLRLGTLLWEHCPGTANWYGLWEQCACKRESSNLLLSFASFSIGIEPTVSWFCLHVLIKWISFGVGVLALIYTGLGSNPSAFSYSSCSWSSGL